MANYPKPKGWDGGPDGMMMRQGSGGRRGWNQYENDDPDDAIGDRRNLHDCYEFEGVQHDLEC